MSQVRRLARQAAAHLKRLADVRFVSVGEKESRGALTGELAVIINVAKKRIDLSRAERIPRELVLRNRAGKEVARVKTDVREVAEAGTAVGIRSGHILRAFDRDQGVCAVSFRAQSGRKYLLTNAHVATNIAAQGRNGPISLVAADGQLYNVGGVVAASNLWNGAVWNQDLAIIEVRPEFVIDHLFPLSDTQPITAIGEFRTEDPSAYWYNVRGRRFACARPRPVDAPTNCEVDGLWVRFGQFWTLSMEGSQIEKGHSGAVVFRETKGRTVACGLVFAANLPNIVWAFPFSRIWAATESTVGPVHGL